VTDETRRNGISLLSCLFLSPLFHATFVTRRRRHRRSFSHLFLHAVLFARHFLCTPLLAGVCGLPIPVSSLVCLSSLISLSSLLLSRHFHASSCTPLSASLLVYTALAAQTDLDLVQRERRRKRSAARAKRAACTVRAPRRNVELAGRARGTSSARGEKRE
jgi:hypothetical protein